MDDLERIERNDTLRAFVQALEDHFPGEGLRAEQIALYTVAIGEDLGLSDAELIDLRCASLLHGAGQLSVSMNDLHGKSGLTQFELEDLKLQASFSVRMLESHDWLKRAAPMVLAAHEAFDGSGFPQGLAGEQIPIGARILAVAEAFLAQAELSSADPGTLAFEAIQRKSGSKLDPQVVESLDRVRWILQPVASFLAPATKE